MKVVELLKTLSQTELIRFEKFINSPYHNENIHLIALYEQFLKRTLIDTRYKKSNFLAEKKWTDLKFRKSCNDILELLLVFNEIERRQSDPLLEKISSYVAALEKEWSLKVDHKRRSIRLLKQTKNSWSEIDLAYYYVFLKSQIDSNLFSPEDSLRLYAEIAQVKKEFFRTSDLSSKLDLENFRQANNYQITPKLLKSLTPFKNDLLKIFNLVQNIMNGGDFAKSFEGIKQILISNEFPKKLSEKILTHCAGSLTTKLNEGDVSITESLFDLYKFGIENDKLFIEVVDYRNIAYLACKEGKFEWALAFLEKYRKDLPEEDQESAYSFTKARTLWYAKDWDGVIRTLRNVEYKDMTYNLLSKIILMTCYYELDEDEALDSFVKSYKVFLRRKRNIPKRRKDAFYGFTTVIGDLAKARERNDYKRIIKAREELANNASIPNLSLIHI